MTGAGMRYDHTDQSKKLKIERPWQKSGIKYEKNAFKWRHSILSQKVLRAQHFFSIFPL